MKLTAAVVIATASVSVPSFAQSYGNEDVRRTAPSPMSRIDVAMSGETIAANRSDDCLVVENICYRKTKDFRPLKLRSHGQWNEDASIKQIKKDVAATDKALKPDSIRIIEDSLEFTVKSLATDDRSFVAEVEFTYGPPRQTVFVFGDFKQMPDGRLGADISRHLDLNEQQRKTRIDIKRLDNNFNPNRDFQAPIAQVDLEDVKRAQAVGDVVASWISRSSAANQH